MSTYTPDMIARMKDAGTLDFGTCESLASDFGLSTRSVIAKAISLDLPYEKATASKAKRVRKADLLAQIEDALGLQGQLASLERATASELQVLLDRVVIQ